MTITLTTEQKNALTVLLNCELRVVTGAGAHPLNEVFRQLVGRDHDTYTRYWPSKTKAPEP